MSNNHYEKRFPIGIQTVVKDKTNLHGNMRYQVNTRTLDGWYISKPVYVDKIHQTLTEQAERFVKNFGEVVDTRYVRKYV